MFVLHYYEKRTVRCSFGKYMHFVVMIILHADRPQIVAWTSIQHTCLHYVIGFAISWGVRVIIRHG